jgi:hypothetical protein
MLEKSNHKDNMIDQSYYTTDRLFLLGKKTHSNILIKLKKENERCR